jgi:kynurenine 3-monooxygenase
MAGTLMAIYLGRRNFNAQVFERRADVRIRPSDRGRSINMTLAARGLHALEQAGVLDQVMALTMPLRGRPVHTEDGRASFQPYGRSSFMSRRFNTRRKKNRRAAITATTVPTCSFRSSSRKTW